jgi:hypothetical protein
MEFDRPGILEKQNAYGPTLVEAGGRLSLGVAQNTGFCLEKEE